MCFWSRKRAIAVKLTSNTAKTIDNARIALRIFSTNQAVFSLMKEFLTSDEFQSPDLRTILSAIIKHNSLTREESSWNTRLFQNATAALRTDRTLVLSTNHLVSSESTRVLVDSTIVCEATWSRWSERALWCRCCGYTCRLGYLPPHWDLRILKHHLRFCLYGELR